MIKLIVGLGNPGKEYEGTRHNIGFTLVDELIRRARSGGKKKQHLSEVCRSRIGGSEVILAKPLTYMNNSGLAVINLLEEEGIQPQEMLVVHDDLDLPLGTTRLRMRGSSAGHRGLDSIINTIKTQDFPRLRLGIGRPGRKEDIVRWVLSPFEEEEMPLVRGMIEKGIRCIERLLALGPQPAMELCNRAEDQG